tara:strand:- start:5986 stop:6207 length:222 start_codon:yes stop_codon:yes gene_type:complete
MLLTDFDQIQTARMLTLRKGLQLEIKGLRHSGRSCYSIIKKEFGLTGTRAKVLEQFEQLIPNFAEITGQGAGK